MTGIALLGAAMVHVAAAIGHAQHPIVFAFFATLVAAQATLGLAELSSDRSPGLGTVTVNTIALAVWLLSRTTGLPFVAGADAVEPVGLADSIAALLELTAIAGAGISSGVGALAPEPAVGRKASSSALTVVAIAVSVAVVAGAVDLRRSPHGHAAVHAGDGDHTQVHADGDGASADRIGGGHGHPPSSSTAGLDGSGVVHDHAVAPAARTSADHAHALPADGHGHRIAGEPHDAAAPAPSDRPPTTAEAVREAGAPATVRYGPFVLPPASVSEAAHANVVLLDVAKPCEDCHLTSLGAGLVYEDGSRANLDTGAMLHHAVWTQEGEPDATCGARQRGARFFASGNERTAITFPDGFGFHVTRARWNLVVEIMNHSATTKTVYVELDVHHRPASDPDLRSVRPVWLDIANCQGSQYTVPAGRHEAVWRWTSNVTGRIVAAGGHVHDGGVKTILRNDTTGWDVCTSWAGYGTDPSYVGSIEMMTTCEWDRIGTVRDGEVLELRSQYDSATAQDDVMGIMLAYVYETDDLTSGTSPPSASGPPSSDVPPPRRHDH